MCHSVCCNVVGNGGVKGQHNAPPPMGRILHTYGQPLNFPGQVFGSAACGSGRDLEPDDGKVRPQSGWTGGEEEFWDGETVQRDGGVNRGVFP